MRRTIGTSETRRKKIQKKFAQIKNIVPTTRAVLKEDKLITGLRLMSWNIITPCAEGCSLYNRCKVKKDGSGCQVEKDYMEHILSPVFKYLENELDEYDLVELGFKYMRLHHNLVRVQKEILAMDIYQNTKFGIRVNPLLAEERNLLQAIEYLDINKLLRQRVKGKVREITAGMSLGGKDGMKVIEILDGSDTDYTNKLSGA